MLHFPNYIGTSDTWEVGIGLKEKGQKGNNNRNAHHLKGSRALSVQSDSGKEWTENGSMI
jgi:hypothetical protein